MFRLKWPPSGIAIKVLKAVDTITCYNFKCKHMYRKD
jgi:hypothetical protein